MFNIGDFIEFKTAIGPKQGLVIGFSKIRKIPLTNIKVLGEDTLYQLMDSSTPFCKLLSAANV